MIIHGDCLDELKNIADDSVDLVCTDPPYQLSSITKPRRDQFTEGSYGKAVPFSRVQARAGFMGKAWDVLPPMEVWQECLRVLKPGAFAFVMSSPRQDSLTQLMIDLTQAGFNMGFSSIYWTYASGFPKAGNIGKLVDKRLGAEREITGYKNDNNRKSPKFQQAYREYDGLVEVPITIPKTDAAKALDGSYAGFQPKPAVEVILVAMKPLSEKTFVDQALKNGKGVTWLDDCRVPLKDGDKKMQGGDLKLGQGNNTFTGQQVHEDFDRSQGRFPANLLVSDDVLNDGVERQATGRPNSAGKMYAGGMDKIGYGLKREPVNHFYLDSGSYSRYFDLDKWYERNKSEQRNTRPNGTENSNLEADNKESGISQSRPSDDTRRTVGTNGSGTDTIIPSTLPFIITPKASKSEKNKGLEHIAPTKMNDGRAKEIDNAFQRGSTLRKNNHPTVKPLRLMCYLITLASRPDDTVLDPFCGSGTTCLAAKQLNREFIGMEKEAEYVEIAKARLTTKVQGTLL